MRTIAAGQRFAVLRAAADAACRLRLLKGASWAGSCLRYEPSTIREYSVEGSPLDIEPSMISTSSVDGSPF